MTKTQMDAMLMELLNEIDYDIAKSFDPDCAEEPDEIPHQMAQLRAICIKHLKKAKK